MMKVLALPLLAWKVLADLFKPEPVISYEQAAALMGRHIDMRLR